MATIGVDFFVRPRRAVLGAGLALRRRRAADRSGRRPPRASRHLHGFRSRLRRPPSRPAHDRVADQGPARIGADCIRARCRLADDAVQPAGQRPARAASAHRVHRACRLDRPCRGRDRKQPLSPALHARVGRQPAGAQAHHASAYSQARAAHLDRRGDVERGADDLRAGAAIRREPVRLGRRRGSGRGPRRTAAVDQSHCRHPDRDHAADPHRRSGRHRERVRAASKRSPRRMSSSACGICGD